MSYSIPKIPFSERDLLLEERKTLSPPCQLSSFLEGREIHFLFKFSIVLESGEKSRLNVAQEKKGTVQRTLSMSGATGVNIPSRVDIP